MKSPTMPGRAFPAGTTCTTGSAAAYLGIGAGAHSFCGRGWGERLAVPADLPSCTGNVWRRARPGGARWKRFDRPAPWRKPPIWLCAPLPVLDEEEFRRRFAAGVAESFPVALRQAAPHLQHDRRRLAPRPFQLASIRPSDLSFPVKSCSIYAPFALDKGVGRCYFDAVSTLCQGVLTTAGSSGLFFGATGLWLRN